MSRWLLSVFFICLATFAQAAFCTGSDLRPSLTEEERTRLSQVGGTVAFGRGNHWIARKGDQSVHIVGTMHLDDPRWPPVMAQIAPIVAEADLLFVEMTDQDQRDMQSALAEQPEKVFITQGPTLPEMLSEDDWQSLSTAMATRGVPAFLAAKMQPWMQTMMLGVPTCAIASPDLAKNGLDMRLMGVARTHDVPVRSLEGFEELYDLIAGGTIEEQLDMLMASLPFAGDSEDQFITTAALYFDEETAAAWEFARIMSYRRSDLPADEVEALLAAFKTKLLVTRNRAWMDHILSAQAPTMVIAVGALHLMGEDGVLSLMQDSGYTLQRAPFGSAP